MSAAGWAGTGSSWKDVGDVGSTSAGANRVVVGGLRGRTSGTPAGPGVDTIIYSAQAGTAGTRFTARLGDGPDAVVRHRRSPVLRVHRFGPGRTFTGTMNPSYQFLQFQGGGPAGACCAAPRSGPCNRDGTDKLAPGRSRGWSHSPGPRPLPSGRAWTDLTSTGTRSWPWSGQPRAMHSLCVELHFQTANVGRASEGGRELLADDKRDSI